MTDWQNRGGTTQQFAKLPPMDLNIEHEFELIDVQTKDNVPDSYNPGKTVNKITTVWKEANRAQDYHKIYAEFNEYYTEKASLMKFLCRVTGRMFMPGVTVVLGEWLRIGMRIRVRVLAKYNRDSGEPTGNYKFVVDGIKPANAPTNPPQSDSVPKPDASLANALLLCKGAQNSAEAAFKLAEAKAPFDLTNAFATADRNGKISYPI